MSKIIGISQARNNLKTVVDRVMETREPYVLARGSKPVAVIISYEEYLENQARERKLWEAEFDVALAQARSHFEEWLRERGYDPDKLSDEEVEKIIREA